ncbi:MAG: alpha/beta fold hydrolase [Ferruginibacter sp.]
MVSKKKTAKKAFALFTTPLFKTKKKREPFKAERRQFDLVLPNKPGARPVRISGYCWPHPQPLKRVLLLHGFGSAAYKFEMYAAPLVKKGYEVLAFDAPAHGDSEGKTTNAVEYSALVKRVIELYGPVQGFVGHSFGGLAISLAMETLPHDADTKIVLIAPATETTTAIDQAFSLLKLKDPEVRAHFDQLIVEIGGLPPEWYSIRRAMQNIKARVLWVHDEEDTVTPLSDALRVKEDGYNNISFLITRGLGHQKIYKDTDVKKQVVNFL